RSKEPRTDGLGELDRNRANPRAATMHQQRLAALEAAALEHVVPNCEERFRNGSGFGRGHAARNGQCMSLVGDTVLRITAAADQGGHLVAYFPTLNARSARRNGAGNFKPWYVGNPRRRRGKPPAPGGIRTGGARRAKPVGEF